VKKLRWLIPLCFQILALAQPVLRLKVPPIAPGSYTVAPGEGRIHVIVQFQDVPTAITLQALTARGAVVIQYVPDNAYLITIDATVDLQGLGIVFGGALTPAQKISPLIANADPAVIRGYYLVEFHRDVDPTAARRLILNLPVQLVENPDLATRHLLVYIPDPGRETEILANLASLDPVDYVFPASTDLIQGSVSAVYAEMLSQNISTVGDGWDGPGLNPVTLSYFFSHLTALLPEVTTHAEILRAMAGWADVAQITWTPGGTASANRAVNILFAQGDHGDGFPFDGPGGTLAHTFYPPPLSTEPLAGDVHFDDTESWHTGSYVDLFSVALHELGHALGLAHSDDPTAVMYPYYKLTSALAQRDKDSILTLYAARTQTTGPPLAPLTLTVNASASDTTAASISLSGTVTGGSGTRAVSWATSAGEYGAASVSGTNWTSAGIPLNIGFNSITFTATDATGNVYRAVTVTRQDSIPSGLALTVNAPPATTALASISLSGTITGATGVAYVRWSLAGSYGTASTNGTNWVAANIPLVVGVNSITVRATDAHGTVSQTVSVTRQTAAPPPPPPGTDTAAPALTITYPASTSVATSLSWLTFKGTASDPSGVASVTFSTNTGGSGTASGTTQWSASIPLLVGSNQVIVRATDTAGNMSWRSVVVTRR